VMSSVSWRITFVLFGLLGVIWAWFFHRAFPDENYPNLSSAPRSAGEGHFKHKPISKT